MDFDKNYAEAVKGLRHRTNKFEREGAYWTKEDKSSLARMFHEGVGVTTMAIYLQRTEPAVFQQIEKQDLYGRKDYPQRQQTPYSVCRCRCTKCQLSVAKCPRHLTYAQRREES